MTSIDWIKEFGEPAPHVPETVVPLSSARLLTDALIRRAKIRAEITARCESPIEVDLAAAIIALAGEEFDVQPQCRIGRFRYDFLIRDRRGRALALLECDGFEFHSKPEQIANDAAKDDFAENIGLPLFRATGYAIHHACDDVAKEIIARLRKVAP